MNPGNKLLVITGSRDWDDEDAVLMLLAQFDPEWTMVYHGKCPTGADAIADRIARELGFVVIPFPADWDRYGNAAGPKRNREMAIAGIRQQRVGVEVHGGVFLGPLRGNRGRGTRDAMDQFKLAGFIMHVIEARRQG